jgi:hypothetical protein
VETAQLDSDRTGLKPDPRRNALEQRLIIVEQPMATATNDGPKSGKPVPRIDAVSDMRTQALDQFFAEMAQRDTSQPSAANRPTRVLLPPDSHPQCETPLAYRPASRRRVAPLHDDNPDGPRRILKAMCVGLLVFGAVMFYAGVPSSWRAAIKPLAGASAPTVEANTASLSPEVKRLTTKSIEDVRVGDRLAGRNPIREQADLVEPEPATWRKISLYMTKENGLGIWVDLLRPLAWIEEHDAKPGSTIFLELPEMGAVGDAAVTYLGPCPKIQIGTGTVVTGTFKHQADENTNVVNLKLEDQIELTGVTNNHPYWSEDRQDFVELGRLRTGELVDTVYGLKHVVSVKPVEHDSFLYNLETCEHVYRVGSLGTLVHNSCALTRYVDDGGHHVFSKKAFEGSPGYIADDALSLGQQELSRLGLKHLGSNSLTTTQQRLFRELATSGRPNTLAEHARIARETLIEHGVDPKDAASAVRKALNQLKLWGITAPVHIPWGG